MKFLNVFSCGKHLSAYANLKQNVFPEFYFMDSAAQAQNEKSLKLAETARVLILHFKSRVNMFIFASFLLFGTL